MSEVKVSKSPPIDDDDDADWIPLVPEQEKAHNGGAVVSRAVIISDESSTCSNETIPHGNGVVKTRPRTPTKNKQRKKGGKYLYSFSQGAFCCGKSKKDTLIISLIITFMVCVFVVAMSISGNHELLMDVIGNRAIDYSQKLQEQLGIATARQNTKNTMMTENEKLQLKNQQHKAARGIRYPTIELNLPPTDTLPSDPLKEQAWKETIQDNNEATAAYLAEEGSAEKQLYREQARLAEEEARKAVEAEKRRIAQRLKEEDEKLRKEREEQHKRWKSDWKSIRTDPIDGNDGDDIELQKKREAAIVASKTDNLEFQINSELKDGDIPKKAFAAQVIAEQERLNAQNRMASLTKEEREAKEAHQRQLEQERIEKDKEIERQRAEQHKRWKSDWRSTREDENDDIATKQDDSLKLQDEEMLLEEAKRAAEVAQALVDAEKRRREQEEKEEAEEDVNELPTVLDEEEPERQGEGEATDEQVVAEDETSPTGGERQEEEMVVEEVEHTVTSTDKLSSAIPENQSVETASTKRRGFRFWRRNVRPAKDSPDRPKRRFRWFGNRRNSKVQENGSVGSDGTSGKSSDAKVTIVPRGVVGLWKSIRSASGKPSDVKVTIVPRGVVGLWKRIRSKSS